MPLKVEDVRKVALALPDTTEEPHHQFGSFRVRGKIFVTIPPGGELLHIFLPDETREHALAMDPEFLEPVLWGSKVLGVRAHLSKAKKATVLQLVKQAYEHKSYQVASRKQVPVSKHKRARMSAA
jgi:YjbR